MNITKMNLKNKRNNKNSMRQQQCRQPFQKRSKNHNNLKRRIKLKRNRVWMLN